MDGAMRVPDGRKLLLSAATHLLMVAALLAGCRDARPRVEKPIAGDFTVVLLPDTQYYQGEAARFFHEQVAWLAAQREALNIVFAIHLGDMTDRNTVDEWKNADRAMRVLDDANIPYTAMPGNHDGIQGGVIDSGNYNRFFGPRRFEGKPWYGGHFGDTNDNSFALFEAGGMKFLVLSLAFGAPDEMLAWGSEVIAAHPDRRVIFATHAYLDDDGTYLERDEEFGVTDPIRRWRDGKQIWERLVSQHPNVFLTVSGHVPGQARRKSAGVHGNVVHELLANYQGRPDGGGGFLRLLRFSPARDRLYVETYSPSRGQHLLDDDDHFVLDYDMLAPGCEPESPGVLIARAPADNCR